MSLSPIPRGVYPSVAHISPQALAACQGTLQIPMSGRCESLNAAVAAAVLLWEGWRQT